MPFYEIHEYRKGFGNVAVGLIRAGDHFEAMEAIRAAGLPTETVGTDRSFSISAPRGGYDSVEHARRDAREWNAATRPTDKRRDDDLSEIGHDDLPTLMGPGVPVDASADLLTAGCTVVREVEWGGFIASLVGDEWGLPSPGSRIYLRAKTWVGTSQPSLYLDPMHPGYRDWRKLLDASPPVRKRYRPYNPNATESAGE